MCLYPKCVIFVCVYNVIYVGLCMQFCVVMWCVCVCMHTLVVQACVVCVLAPLLPSVSRFFSAFVHLCREGLEVRTGSSKPSGGSCHLSPLHLHFVSQAAVGAELLAARVHPPPSQGGCLTLCCSRDMCERSSYFYPALTGCDGSVEEGLSAFQGY